MTTTEHIGTHAEDGTIAHVPGIHDTPSSTRRAPRIALLSPYNGGNLGDAVIQDSVIANLRSRLKDCEFSGITLNSANFIARHGTAAFPLLETHSPFYGMQKGSEGERQGPETKVDRGSGGIASLGRVVSRIPVAGSFLKAVYRFARRLWHEVRHAIRGYRFLRAQDLLIVSGGGQLDEEWGGPWHHPFALFKWAVLARLADVPYTVVSVGACKAQSPVTRFFLSQALKFARLRSYRDQNSRRIAASFWREAENDKIVPDLAFSLPSSELPLPFNLSSLAQGRTVVAFSPIAYVKPGNWPSEDRALYERYVQESASVISALMEHEYFVVIVWSSLGDDESVISEILQALNSAAKAKVDQQLHMPSIKTWQDLLAQLATVDVLIASRLHSLILGLIAGKPVVALSFDPKVDWLMDDLNLSESLFKIHTFRSHEVVDAVIRLEEHRPASRDEIESYRERVSSAFSEQYDQLAHLALTSMHEHR